MDIYQLYAAISPIFRKRRMRRFMREIPLGPDTTILDVGGFPATWEAVPKLECRITILNIDPQAASAPRAEKYDIVIGDGTALPFADRSFSVVFSNSVIEHVGDHAQQAAFAREVSRVGRSLWIQTPAKSFFIEPHLIAPFVHWLPLAWQKRVVRCFTLRGLMTKPTPAEIAEFLASIRLLSYHEFAALFPDCGIFVERFFGMAKSYTAIRKAA